MLKFLILLFLTSLVMAQPQGYLNSYHSDPIVSSSQSGSAEHSELVPNQPAADQSSKAKEEEAKAKELAQQVSSLCQEVSNRLASVDYSLCADLGYDRVLGYSVQSRPIIAKHYPAHDPEAIRVLFIGGIHGDELTSVSATFLWMNTLNEHHSGAFDWWFVPVSNPDGLLRQNEQGRWTSTRGNINDVDLNRNFTPSQNRYQEPRYRQAQQARNPRYFPGDEPLSEPESLVIDRMILSYQPDIIFSVHAPHGIIDFDGPPMPFAPTAGFGSLGHRALGTFPGSLGDFAWNRMGVPVVTIELASAGQMPSDLEIRRMWRDMVRYLFNLQQSQMLPKR